MGETKVSVDLRISKKFKYTPIFKTSFILAKEKQRKKSCWCCATKVSTIIGYAVLALVIILCLAGSVTLWTTDTYSTLLLENLPLRNDSQSIEWWKNPPVKPKLQIYFFNYTNVNEFLSTGEKLKVEEIGPYTYYERTEKVNLVWNNNGTITFQNRRTYEFVPELSNGTELDRLVTPNMPLLAAASAVRNENYLVKLSLATFLHSVNARPFVNVNVRQLLWGYEDPIFTVGRTVMSHKHKVGTNKFGLMTQRVGTSPWRITLNTGEFEMGSLDVITHYNGEDHLKFWKTSECNRIDGSEGMMFPPQMVKQHSTIHIYNRDICRRLPLVFKEHSKVFHGIPTLRFQPPRNVFAHPSENPDNACFCDPSKSVCPPSGVFNISPCVFDAPILISFPHFYLGDPTLLETVDGLQPDPENHDSYVDLHPELAVPLAAKAGFQINMMVHKVPGVDHLYRFKERDILPISYFVIVLDELPEEIRSTLFHATYSARTLQLALMYGLPTAAVLALLALLEGVRRLRRRPTTTDSAPPSPDIITPSAAAVVATAAAASVTASEDGFTKNRVPEDMFCLA